MREQGSSGQQKNDNLFRQKIDKRNSGARDSSFEVQQRREKNSGRKFYVDDNTKATKSSQKSMLQWIILLIVGVTALAGLVIIFIIASKNKDYVFEKNGSNMLSEEMKEFQKQQFNKITDDVNSLNHPTDDQLNSGIDQEQANLTEEQMKQLSEKELKKIVKDNDFRNSPSNAEQNGSQQAPKKANLTEEQMKQLSEKQLKKIVKDNDFEDQTKENEGQNFSHSSNQHKNFNLRINHILPSSYKLQQKIINKHQNQFFS